MSAAEVAVGLLILVSAFLSMAAGIGIIRFPDVLTRLHAATKPQVLGLAVVLLAIVLQAPSWGVLTTIVLVMTFQLLTQPMTAHMLGRAGLSQRPRAVRPAHRGRPRARHRGTRSGGRRRQPMTARLVSSCPCVSSRS